MCFFFAGPARLVEFRFGRKKGGVVRKEPPKRRLKGLKMSNSVPMSSQVPCDGGLMSTSMRPSVDNFEQNIPSRSFKIDFSPPLYSTKRKIDQSKRCISLDYPKISSNRMPLFCLTKHKEELPVQRLSRVCRENMPTETSLWRLR